MADVSFDRTRPQGALFRLRNRTTFTDPNVVAIVVRDSKVAISPWLKFDGAWIVTTRLECRPEFLQPIRIEHDLGPDRWMT